MREQSFSLYKSVYDASAHLSKRSRGAFLVALADFYFYGIEPHDLPRDAQNVWRGVEYRISRARTKANPTANERLSDGYAAASERLASGYAQVTEDVADSLEDDENACSPANTCRAHADAHSDAHTDSWGWGWGLGMGLGKDISSGKPNHSPAIQEVVQYLNDKTGKHFSPSSKATARAIAARLNEGYTVEDFKRVVDTKASQWGKDPKMCAYLRPETLFNATHFESYLNEKGVTHGYSEYDC